MKTTGLIAVLGAAAIGFATPASAQMSMNNVYVGGGIGQSKFKGELSCDGVSGPGVSCDDKDTAFKIFAGYQINRNFAAELTYQDFGKVSASAAPFSVEIKSHAFDLSALGMLPFAGQFAGYGRLGVYAAKSEGTTNIPGVSNASESNTGLVYGLGLQWDPMPKLGVRVEWQVYNDVGGGDLGKGDIEVLGLSALWRF
jgi:OOP family OmpA-OmpF porin